MSLNKSTGYGSVLHFTKSERENEIRNVLFLTQLTLNEGQVVYIDTKL